MARNTSFTLSDHFVQFIDEQVASGRYGSASEVVREGLRLVEARERELTWLREQVAAGIEDIEAGRTTLLTEDVWEDMASRAVDRYRQEQQDSVRAAS